MTSPDRDTLDRHLTRGPHRESNASGSHGIRTMSVASKPVGALALGAVAIGALAIGALAIGRLAIGRARIRRLEIDELVIRQHRVTERLRAPSGAINFINPPELARPPGYSQVAVIRGGRIVYIAGQVAVDQQGQLIGTGDFEAQADQVFRNLAAALASVGCTPRELVKLTVFVRDMSHLASYRKARDRFLGATTPPAAPAITLVEVSRLFAEEYLIEIEAVAAAA